MSAQNTTLAVVNTSGADITWIDISKVDSYDWESGNRPDRNFQGASIANNDSRCQPEDLNSHAKSSPCNFRLIFRDGTDLTFRTDQKDALTKHNRLVTTEGSASGRLKLYQSSGGGMNALTIVPATLPDNSGWMGKLLAVKPDVTVNALTMPGSHDAGMYKITDTSTICADDWALTQDRTIFEQLQSGSRYFDLRVRRSGGIYYTGHYSSTSSSATGLNGGSLADVLADVVKFMKLDAARKETVFLKFSHTEDKLDTADIVAKISDGLGDYKFTTPNSELVIQKAALRTFSGKVVCLYDSEFKKQWNFRNGAFPYIDIPNPPFDNGFVQTWPNLPPVYDPSRVGPTYTIDEPGMQVFDHYADSSSYTTMASDQNSLLNRWGGYGQNYAFLISWTLTGSATSSVKDVRVLATMCNPHLPNYTTAWRTEYKGLKSTIPPTRPNIVYYDFVTPELCSCIIDVNYLK
ncbi:hypothetical protein [Azospirillum rugosum]|uniref:Phosphatidylinositol diacylglycerol-lyase n=1 Tax=Azospirillum rugosum TaxID=416170 RepID=A0ABS4SHM1_9PROT|nr:hypothetical protein [Azospirillum rugosum]MBP2292076.1 hypothetical protein [Azospirillum rugosum]MDQ0525788.1 hypothetical protein [Azospirillum rugosum]